jgi:hypothetical protein
MSNLEEKLVETPVANSDSDSKINEIRSPISIVDQTPITSQTTPTQKEEMMEPSRIEMLQTECAFILSWCKVTFCKCCLRKRTSSDTHGPATKNAHYFNKVIYFKHDINRISIFDKQIGTPTELHTHSRYDFSLDIDEIGNITKRNFPGRIYSDNNTGEHEKSPNKMNKLMCELNFVGLHDITELFMHIEYEDWTTAYDFAAIWYYLKKCDGIFSPTIPRELYEKRESPILSIINDTAEMIDYFGNEIIV